MSTVRIKLGRCNYGAVDTKLRKINKTFCKDVFTIVQHRTSHSSLFVQWLIKYNEEVVVEVRMSSYTAEFVCAPHLWYPYFKSLFASQLALEFKARPSEFAKVQIHSNSLQNYIRTIYHQVDRWISKMAFIPLDDDPSDMDCIPEDLRSL